MSSSSPHPLPTHLIIVCCHAIYTGPSTPSSLSSSSSQSPSSTDSSHPSNWLLAPFQTDEVPTFTEHIQAGLKLLASSSSSPKSKPGQDSNPDSELNPGSGSDLSSDLDSEPKSKSTSDSLLVFSGSKTRPEIDKSEARSYLYYCLVNNFWGILPPKTDNDESVTANLRSRILLEEQALDSFHNILFSLLLFWKTASRWPEKMTIISHAFKRARFMELHIPALRFPLHRVVYVGIDPGYMQPSILGEGGIGEGNKEYDAGRSEEVRRGERERGFGVWVGDPRGERAVLRGKRTGRWCWGVDQRWFEDDEERRESGVVSRRVEWVGVDGMVRERRLVEEVLGSGRQPWEED
ncbi:hypothetical protein DL98DRAFT_568486 [Cadophora sp. DSE1049]|nr:hypothetical protein DL98DRAFT_568486 [Cadophora sp. DSE1049]